MRNEPREYTIVNSDRTHLYVCHAYTMAHAFAQIRVFEPDAWLVVLDSQPLATQEN